MSKVQVVSELWEFMKQNKKYWLAPIVITLVLFGVLLVLAKSSAIAPSRDTTASSMALSRCIDETATRALAVIPTSTKKTP